MKCTCGLEMIKGTGIFGDFNECVSCDIRQYGDGTPADKECRELRIRAHAVFDAWWKKQGITRKQGYIHLARTLRIKQEKAHMRYMSKGQCRKVISTFGEGPK